MLFVSLSFLTE